MRLLKHIPAEATRGQWDRFRIEQVLINLLTNAFRYGAGHPVDVELESSKDTATLIVQDRGQGIATEDRSRIFERFAKATANGDASGLGLGLYISKQIVAAHGGQLKVTSEIGKGSRFTVELPCTARTRREL